MIKIQCSQKNFRRGGIAHPNGVSFYPEDQFSEKDLELIKNEPMLMVQTGLDPNGPETMSMKELKAALTEAKIEFIEQEPRHQMVYKLIKDAEIKADDQKTESGKKSGKNGATE